MKKPTAQDMVSEELDQCKPFDRQGLAQFGQQLQQHAAHMGTLQYQLPTDRDLLMLWMVTHGLETNDLNQSTESLLTVLDTAWHAKQREIDEKCELLAAQRESAKAVGTSQMPASNATNASVAPLEQPIGHQLSVEETAQALKFNPHFSADGQLVSESEADSVRKTMNFALRQPPTQQP